MSARTTEKLKKSVLITGCSSGIGLCVAKGLQSRGYRVFATTRNLQDVETLTQSGLESLQLDLDDSDSINSAVDEIISRTGGQLFALFNNGGYGQPGAVEDLTRTALKAQFENNFFGGVELINRVIPIMRKQGYGRIIQNTSIFGFIALPYRGAYVASKYAMEGLTDTLRLELAGSNIHVSIIEPGPIATDYRIKSHDAFKKYIDPFKSHHKENYVQLVNRLTQDGPVASFTLPPTAVLKKVIHALESPSPKIRYTVTFPTYVFSVLRRFLPWKILDKILLKAGR